jgi:pyridinium-3,5-biscarboxylic acid mononucleotide synthase
MNEAKLKRLLQQVKTGAVPIDEALNELRGLPFEDLGFARIDHHRTLRTGYPEVVYCAGKTPEQCAKIVQRLATHDHVILATRASQEAYQAIAEVSPQARYYEIARIVLVGKPKRAGRGKPVVIVSAGTADLPVAEEAAVTAEALGRRVERLYDVGVAGLHRLLAHKEVLFGAGAIVVVAGMEGALASVVGGLVRAPVIAVPTSVGYGASFQGLAALLSMLNCCAAGVTVVNIDNGFGAGYFAALITGKNR